jgi:hypothetical protein
MDDMGDAVRDVELHDAETDEFTAPWSTPWAVTALRRVSLFLALAGLAEAVVWFGNVRLSGSSGGAVTNIFVATFGGALALAVAMAVIAYVLELFIYLNHTARLRLVSQTAEA